MYAALCGTSRLRDDQRQALAVGMIHIHNNLFGELKNPGTELTRSHHLLAAVQMAALRLYPSNEENEEEDNSGGGGGTSRSAETNTEGMYLEV